MPQLVTLGAMVEKSMYLSTPDLVERFANGWELNPPADMNVWSAPTTQGYTDFPFYSSTPHT